MQNFKAALNPVAVITETLKLLNFKAKFLIATASPKLQTWKWILAGFKGEFFIKKNLAGKKTELEKEYKELEKSVSGKLEKIEKDKNKVGAQKEKLLKDVNEKIVVFYEKIRKWAGNTAVVPVRKQACYGCFMKINDKTYSAVVKSDDIVTCPYCGRILYKEA